MSFQEPFPEPFQESFPSSLGLSPAKDEEISTIELIERESKLKRKNIFLRAWYRLAAPKDPGEAANLKQREVHRRGQMVSLVLLFLLVVQVVLWLTVGVFVNPTVFPIFAGLLVVLLGTMALNRGGHILAAGIVIVVVTDFGLAMNIITSLGGVGVYHLPLLDLFVEGEILAVVLLPAEWVFVVAAVHIAFIVSVLTWLPIVRTKELTTLIHTPALIDFILRPIVVQSFVAVGTYVWANSAAQALQRADRAATIAAFEHSLSEQAMEETEERKSLDQSIQVILDALSQFANNKRGIHIAREQIDRRLWDVVNNLNEQFARAQNLSQAEIQLERTHKAAQHFLTEAQRTPLLPIFWQATGTVMDAVVKEHNARLSTKQVR